MQHDAEHLQRWIELFGPHNPNMVRALCDVLLGAAQCLSCMVLLQVHQTGHAQPLVHYVLVLAPLVHQGLDLNHAKH